MKLGGAGAAIATAGLVVAVDQATKQLAVSNIERGRAVNVFFGPSHWTSATSGDRLARSPAPVNLTGSAVVPPRDENRARPGTFRYGRRTRGCSARCS